MLLEPYYEFRLEIPTENVGRALSDIQRMNGSFQPPVTEEDMTLLTGEAPVSAMRDYQTEVVSYTKGRGRLFCALSGYQPCQEQDEIVGEIGYDPESDLEKPTSSVFCAHGAGFVVPWNQVEEYMHVESIWEAVSYTHLSFHAWNSWSIDSDERKTGEEDRRMTVQQQVITILMVVLGTMLTRFLPFLIFPADKPTPKYIQYLGKVLPAAALGLLVVYCLKDVSVFQGSHGIPELISVILIVVLHFWKRQMLLSIAGGTICYMVLVQTVF